ncbi:hypothetical protein FKZ61_006665 [Litorilinea aerophila]|uniref:Uncharacterized protein n=1 Tax=Litorilinea aerophila TaxID=1204385 RepID=A0A540VIM4_9CHLR|nr:hypothetical protein [Litorilinea aerophila]MCC9075789.1 hypothetical protein [Litorilinea aerophila]
MRRCRLFRYGFLHESGGLDLDTTVISLGDLLDIAMRHDLKGQHPTFHLGEGRLGPHRQTHWRGSHMLT